LALSKRRLEIFCQKVPADRPVSSTAASAPASAEALLAVKCAKVLARMPRQHFSYLASGSCC